MATTRTAPYGSFESPITADLIARAGIALSQPAVEKSAVYWVELRPAEGGRSVVVRRTPAGEISDVTPPEYNVRTAVHEYGGGAYTVHGGTVFFSNWADQRIYRQVPGDEPRPVSPAPDRPRSLRYADFRVTPDGRMLVCVRESHPAKGEAVNEIVALPAEGGEPTVLATGRDFYSAPRVSPDGTELAWLEWDHPNMPWDGTELKVARWGRSGPLAGVRAVAGGEEESVVEPAYGPGGELHYISDRTGFWNLYAVRETGDVCLWPVQADCSQPPWVFGRSAYCFLADGRILLRETREGRDHLLLLSPRGELETELAEEAVAIEDMVGGGDRAYVLAAGRETPLRLLLLDESGAATVLAQSLSVDIAPEWISVARAIDFPTGDGAMAHAFFYPPTNPHFAGPRDQRPPLVVMSHGGPTSFSSSALSLGVQYFTSRGIAVVDVNYRGSTGYGRQYRNALRGNWGVADTEDCANAAKHLADEGFADPKRLAIRGGSAGGYTTLCALAFTDVFAAGVSRYGVADLAALARDTHKFESRYLDRLVGPWPEREDLYRERSPIHHVDGFSCPLLIQQGLEDPVVPPAQSVSIFEAVREKGIPCAYLPFEGEQHGFRRGENIRRSLEAELYFYGKIFGFTPADEIEPFPIENL